jgi:LacI family transcriptional regulator
MVTIQDVAKHAGVSAMTVSRYINESSYVSEKAKIKIENSINELNYRMNMVAKSLVTKKTMTIGLIIASIADPFYPILVLGVEDEASQRGYNVILCNADGKKKENEYIEILYEKRVDGIIFSHLSIGPEQLDLLKDIGLEGVLIDNEINGLDVGYVKSNDILGGYLATEYLIRLGHRKIGTIHGNLCYNEKKENQRYTETFQFQIWNNRLKGYLDAMSKYGVKINKDFIIESNEIAQSEFENGYLSMKKMLKFSEVPTAVYAQNDFMAVGAINAIQEMGYKVPEDFSIIGQDGITLGEMIFPKLTTAELPRYELGRSAADMLISLINNSNKEKKTILLDPKIVIRGTTAQLRE